MSAVVINITAMQMQTVGTNLEHFNVRAKTAILAME
jgi:hypothetical protein